MRSRVERVDDTARRLKLLMPGWHHGAWGGAVEPRGPAFGVSALVVPLACRGQRSTVHNGSRPACPGQDDPSAEADRPARTVSSAGKVLGFEVRFDVVCCFTAVELNASGGSHSS